MDQARIEERTREWMKANSWVALRSVVQPMPETSARLSLQGVMACRRLMNMQDRDWHEYFVVGTN